MYEATPAELEQFEKEGLFAREGVYSEQDLSLFSDKLNVKRPGGPLYTDVDKLEGEFHPVSHPAGSVLWFHYDLVHGSQTNRSDTDRRAFLAAYPPAGLRRWRLDKSRPIRTGRFAPAKD